MKGSFLLFFPERKITEKGKNISMEMLRSTLLFLFSFSFSFSLAHLFALFTPLVTQSAYGEMYDQKGIHSALVFIHLFFFSSSLCKASCPFARLFSLRDTSTSFDLYVQP